MVDNLFGVLAVGIALRKHCVVDVRPNVASLVLQLRFVERASEQFECSEAFVRENLFRNQFFARTQIHEFGGTIPARVAHGRAMAIKLAGGQVIFRKSARGFDMPERSYMRSAFEEKAPDGMAQLREAVLVAIGATR